MFSRSEKTEEVIDPMAEPSGQRSPMVLASLADLLAIAGAFLLVWYLNNGSSETASTDGGSQSTSAPDESSQQVLVVTQAIPRGTSVNELIEAPTVYLSARAVPEQFVAASAITSVAELGELSGMILASEALPGEQLLRGRFRDPSDFDSNTETFLEAETAINIPVGHHAIVFELPSSRAMGGNIRPGEQVTVIAAFRVSPPDGDAIEISVVALNAIELLNIESSLEVAGQISSDINQVGIANRGSYVITAAVTPEELTDLTFAMSYGDITLATAVDGLNNDDGPRAVTTMYQVLGDDGVWLTELDDGNLVDLIGLFPTLEAAEGQSIQLDLADDASDDTENTADTPEDEPAPEAEDEAVGDS